MTNESCWKIKYVLKSINCYATASQFVLELQRAALEPEKKNAPNIFGREFPDGHSQDKQVTV